MKSITTLYKGASAEVLKTYYIAAIRSLIDYSAPVLQLASKTQINILNKIQNTALRIILGAPCWTKIRNMKEK